MLSFSNIEFLVWVRCFTFNHAPYIVDTMNGFTKQRTTFPYICTIVDDASTDGEPEAIRKYVEQYFDLDDAATVHHEETSDYNLLYARHKENKNCYFAIYWLKYNHHSINKSKLLYLSGWSDVKYKAICEGDDYWASTEKIQRQASFLEDNCDYVMIYSSAKILKKGRMDGIIGFKTCDFESIIKNNGIPTLTTMFRQEIYKKYYNEIIPITPQKWMMGDYPLWLFLSLNGKIQYINEPLCVYRKLEESASHSTNQQKSLLFAESICQIRIFFIQYVEQISGLKRTSLRKQVAKENIKRVLSVYFSFKDFEGANNYLREKRKDLSFYSLFTMELRILKHVLQDLLGANKF